MPQAFHAPFPVSARVFGLRPNTCRPTPDGATCRTREKTSGTQGNTGRLRPKSYLFRLEAYEMVAMSLVEVQERVGKSVISVGRKTPTKG